jgi:hypothetical protein
MVVLGDDEGAQRLPRLLPQDPDARAGSECPPHHRICTKAFTEGVIISIKIEIVAPDFFKIRLPTGKKEPISRLPDR